MNQIQKRPDSQLTTSGAFATADAANAALRRAMETMNLISPATFIARVPDGFDLVLSQVLVDLSSRQGDRGNTIYTSGDVDPTDGGKLGISKTVLMKIAAALGVTWLESYRVDDGSHPYYCHWRCLAEYKAFSGQDMRVPGNKQMDLRDGSPQASEQTEKQLHQQRKFIMEHAETKAMLRAIRSTGLKTSYTLDDLRKPFVAARLMMTGRSDDPRLRRLFAAQIAENFSNSSRALYPSAAQQPRALPPPPINAVNDDDDDYDDSTGETHASIAESAQQHQQPAQTQQAQPAQQQRAAAPRAHVIPGGPNKNTPLDKATDKDLNYWANKIGRDLEENTARDPDGDSVLHKAICDELSRRAQQGQGGQGQGDLKL